MIYGSVCSGIEAATAAWHPLGWRAAFYSEIDRFPSALLSHHYPATPNLGDINLFKAWPHYAIDALVGGTPCQSFSIAGLRKGLDDPRGNIMLAYLAVAAVYRPVWLVWENVAGVLSSNKGRDFGALLGGMASIGYGFAYRVFNAEYFGLAQRRRRVFVIGHLGDWRRAASVLFERQSMSRDPSPNSKAGPDAAARVDERAARGGHKIIDCSPAGIAGTVSKKWSKGTGGPAGDEHYNLVAYRKDAASDLQARRLTPRECERLMGFRDDYTLIPFNARPATDAARYRALGNSMPVPVIEWLGQRMALVDSIKSGVDASGRPTAHDLVPALA